MPFGMIVAAGISAGASASSASSASNANRNTRRRGQLLLNRFERRQDHLMDQRLSGLQESKAAVAEGYDQSKAELARADYGSRRRIFDEQKQLQGQLASRDVASGSFSGTAAASRYRGLSDRTQRKLLDVDATIGRMYSGLAERRGAAMGIAEENIANFYGQRRNAEYETFSDRMNLFGANRGPVSGQTYDFGGLGLALGDVFGSVGDWWSNRGSGGGGGGGGGFSGGGASGGW